MKATWDRLEKNTVQYAVEVPAERLSKAMEAAFRQLNQRAVIPGFRKGKAPRFLYERQYGKASILEEALNRLVPQAYAEAVDESGFEPIDDPRFELETAEEGKDLLFKAKVEVKPEVKLGPQSGFKEVKYEIPLVTEIQVDEQLESLRDRVAQLVPDENGVVLSSSYVTIDYDGFLDGEPFEGGKAEDRSFEIGKGGFVPGFEEQITGMKLGDEREIKVTFPADYRASNLAGKETVFKIRVKDIKKKELPELDDAFAQQVSRFQTLQELREDLTNRLKEAAEQDAKQKFEDKVVDAVVAGAEVELPEVLVHRRQHTLLHNLERDLQRQGLSMEQYLQLTNKDSQALHDELHEPAERSMKASLVLEAVSKQEGITASDDEVDARIDEIVRSVGADSAQVRKLKADAQYRSEVQYDLVIKKTIAHLSALNK